MVIPINLEILMLFTFRQIMNPISIWIIFFHSTSIPQKTLAYVAGVLGCLLAQVLSNYNFFITEPGIGSANSKSLFGHSLFYRKN